jgi:hypothetical protein
MNMNSSLVHVKFGSPPTTYINPRTTTCFFPLYTPPPTEWTKMTQAGSTRVNLFEKNLRIAATSFDI